MRYKKTILAVAATAALTTSLPTFAIGDSAVLAPLINLTTAAVNGTTAAITTGFTTVGQYLMRIENTMSANSAKLSLIHI
jgi:hypothetical protein